MNVLFITVLWLTFSLSAEWYGVPWFTFSHIDKKSVHDMAEYGVTQNNTYYEVVQQRSQKIESLIDDVNAHLSRESHSVTLHDLITKESHITSTSDITYFFSWLLSQLVTKDKHLLLHAHALTSLLTAKLLLRPFNVQVITTAELLTIEDEMKRIDTLLTDVEKLEYDLADHGAIAHDQQEEEVIVEALDIAIPLIGKNTDAHITKTTPSATIHITPDLLSHLKTGNSLKMVIDYTCRFRQGNEKNSITLQFSMTEPSTRKDTIYIINSNDTVILYKFCTNLIIHTYLNNEETILPLGDLFAKDNIVIHVLKMRNNKALAVVEV